MQTETSLVKEKEKEKEISANLKELMGAKEFFRPPNFVPIGPLKWVMQWRLKKTEPISSSNSSANSSNKQASWIEKEFLIQSKDGVNYSAEIYSAEKNLVETGFKTNIFCHFSFPVHESGLFVLLNHILGFIPSEQKMWPKVPDSWYNCEMKNFELQVWNYDIKNTIPWSTSECNDIGFLRFEHMMNQLSNVFVFSQILWLDKLRLDCTQKNHM